MFAPQRDRLVELRHLRLSVVGPSHGAGELKRRVDQAIERIAAGENIGDRGGHALNLDTSNSTTGNE
ncbi:hypothetical protein [Paraburkholderia youngii]|uniref:hypothetical protein n=1 Tax=Paraburkholderia youngii TaxID=2782701 RepID=UPI0015917D31|nr:hypothetical protein [Paraburkholderia youngii]NUX58511.1 hypothetical protein [Paraburkholderia youngii]